MTTPPLKSTNPCSELPEGKISTIPFLDFDISSMYIHTIKAFVPLPKWVMASYQDLDDSQKAGLEKEFTRHNPKLLWSEPVALVAMNDFMSHSIQEEREWVDLYTKQVFFLEHCTFMENSLFLFQDWDEALAFKLAWVDQ